MGKRSYGISLGVFNLIALLRLRMVNALPFIYLPVRVARKASDRLAADWSYQTHVRKLLSFCTCPVMACLTGLEILIKLCSLYNM